jgi:hypothetical protein
MFTTAACEKYTHVCAFICCQIWRVERSKDGHYTTVELERKYNGQLFGGDCYIILYTYLVNKHTFHIVYYWLVRTYEET